MKNCNDWFLSNETRERFNSHHVKEHGSACASSWNNDPHARPMLRNGRYRDVLLVILHIEELLWFQYLRARVYRIFK